MNPLEKWMILTPLQKLPNNVGDLGKIIVATSLEWLPKLQKRQIWSHWCYAKMQQLQIISNLKECLICGANELVALLTMSFQADLFASDSEE